MSWLKREETKSKNPAKKFLSWKSEEKKFGYYDKEKEENVLIDLPFKFVILEHYHTVKGWNDASESGIYSNEVFQIGNEELQVKSFKGGKIAEGLYKDNKPTIVAAGGHYARSIYAVTNDLEIINISLKGSGVSSYSDFINDIGDGNFDKNWIEVTEAKELKKGKVKYSIPIFKKSTAIKDKSKLMPFADELQDYMIDYTAEETEVVRAKQKQEEDDDLAF
jgi:hypothetical protein